MNGSAKEILVKKTQTVEGKSNDYKSIFLFFGGTEYTMYQFW